MLGLFANLYLRALGPDPKVIFIILIIILNLHDPSLSGFDCNTRPGALNMDLTARSCHKSMIIKKKKNLILQNKIKKKRLIEKKETIKQIIIPMNSDLKGGVQ